MGSHKKKSSKKDEKRHKKSKKDKKEKRKLKRLNEEKKTKEPCDESSDIPVHLMEKSKSMAPMTKEQWEKQQSVVRRVYDETTNRQRLVKGDGEIIEEIVSRDRHKAINKQATLGDGQFFQSQLNTK